MSTIRRLGLLAQPMPIAMKSGKLKIPILSGMPDLQGLVPVDFENQPNVGAGLVPAQNTDSSQTTGQPQVALNPDSIGGLPLQNPESSQVHQGESNILTNGFGMTNHDRS